LRVARARARAAAAPRRAVRIALTRRARTHHQTKKYLHAKSPARLPGFHTCVGGGGAAQDADWYAAHRIKVLHGGGARVTVADVSSQRLATLCGRVVQYDSALVIATGAAPARLPDAAGGALRGVHYIRSEQDAAALMQHVQQLKDNNVPAAKNVVIIGGGYIGMEVAAGLAPHGVNVTMVRHQRACYFVHSLHSLTLMDALSRTREQVFPETHLMPRLFTPAIAAHYERLYEQRGIKILKARARTTHRLR
jgi:monodehydroascorbate reductase (NADH)